MPSVLAPVAASSSELRSMPLADDGVEVDPSNEAKSELDRPTELIAHLSIPDYKKHNGGMQVSRHRRKGLLQKFKNCLRRLVRLLQRGNTRLLQGVVFRHVRNRLSHVCVADAALGAGQVLHLVVHHVACR